MLPKVVTDGLHHGWIGVQIFFVISGFVIAYALREVWMTPSYFRSFAAQRSLRLGPPYWCTIVFVIALQMLATAMMTVKDPLLEHLPSWPQLLLHTVYLQNIFGYSNISVGFWTLCIEMQFYLLFALMLGCAQRLATRFGGNSRVASSISLTAVFLPPAVASLFWLSIDGGKTEHAGPFISSLLHT